MTLSPEKKKELNKIMRLPFGTKVFIRKLTGSEIHDRINQLTPEDLFDHFGTDILQGAISEPEKNRIFFDEDYEEGDRGYPVIEVWLPCSGELPESLENTLTEAGICIEYSNGGIILPVYPDEIFLTDETIGQHNGEAPKAGSYYARLLTP